MHRHREAAALISLFALSLRNSTPFATGEGPQRAYYAIRVCLSKRLFGFGHEAGDKWSQLCCERLGSALLRTDTLHCYARLLSDAAQQLQPAAAEALSACTASCRPGMIANTARARAAAGPTEPSGAQPEGQQGRLEQQGGNQHGPLPQQPSLQDLQVFLRDLFFFMGVFEYPALQVRRAGDAPANGSDRLSDGDAAASSSFARQLMHDMRDQVHSACLLEHWARVLLLGTAPALASGGCAQQQEAQAVQCDLLRRLCDIHGTMGLYWSDFLRQPCGCALAATHMAHLCAALDGGHAFGLPRPAVIVLPLCPKDHRTYLRSASPAAELYDAAAMQHYRLVSLLAPLCTIRSWITLLTAEVVEFSASVQEAGQEGSGSSAGAEQAGATGQEGNVGSAGAEQAGGTGQSQPEVASAVEAAGGVGAEEELPAAYGPGSKLPPLNRPATVALCLRLAKGVAGAVGRGHSWVSV